MKRVLTFTALAIVCAALALPVAVSVSRADQNGPHLVTVPLTFRTQDIYATLYSRDPAKARKSSGTAGFIDSLGFARGAAAECTTTAIPLTGIAPVGGGNVATPDSMTILGRLVIQEAAGATWNGLPTYVQKGLDSIYVNVEVATTAGGRWIRCVDGSMLPFIYAALDTTTGRAATFAFKNSGVLRTAINIHNLRGWPFIRFIISADKTNSSIMEATWNYYSSNTADTK